METHQQHEHLNLEDLLDQLDFTIGDEDINLNKLIYVREYFRENMRYFFNDLYYLENIESVYSYGYCGVPQLLSIFSITELWGYLLNSENKTEQKQRIFFFIERFMPSVGASKEALLSLVRHGIAHLYFPKYIAISKCSPGEESNFLFFLDESNKVVLNINHFTKLVKQALFVVRDELRTYRHIEKIYERLKTIEERDGSEFKKISRLGVFDDVPKQRLSSYTTVMPTEQPIVIEGPAREI